AGASVLGFSLDAAQNSWKEVMRRDEKRFRRPTWSVGRAGELVEEIGDVVGDRAVGCEQTEIRVLLAGAQVVVPRSDVRIAPNRLALTPNHQRNLRVVLESHQSADDVAAGGFERARPADIHVFV